MNAMKTGRLSLAVISLAALAMPLSSGDYQAKTVAVQPVESYPARVTIEQVTVAVDPYPNDRKSHTAFDVKDLNSRGYFPAHVIIKNASANHLGLRTRNIVLVSPKGQEYYTTPATLVVQDVVGSTSTKTGSPLLDFTSKELTNVSIEPGAVVNGFVFFYTPEPKKNLFAGSKLHIPSIRDETAQKDLGPFDVSLDPALPAAEIRRK
jgi:hypothetical protein